MEYTEYIYSSVRSPIELIYNYTWVIISGKMYFKLLNKYMAFKIRDKFKIKEKIQEKTDISFIFLKRF